MLTIKQIDAAKPKEKAYRLPDSGGLFLFIPPTGKKVWRLRYRHQGKEKTLVIGSYPALSLAEARAAQAEAKFMLTVLAGVAQMECEFMLERQREGYEAAKQSGRITGRGKSSTIDRRAVKGDLQAGVSIRKIAEKYKISTQTVMKIKSE